MTCGEGKTVHKHPRALVRGQGLERPQPEGGKQELKEGGGGGGRSRPRVAYFVMGHSSSSRKEGKYRARAWGTTGN